MTLTPIPTVESIKFIVHKKTAICDNLLYIRVINNISLAENTRNSSRHLYRYDAVSVFL